LYSDEDIQLTYSQVYDLLVTRHIIKNHSTNSGDIRFAALEDADLSAYIKVLDLGCGYGFFVESLNNRLHGEARITGLDLVENNQEAFLHSVHASGYKGDFITGRADIIADMEDEAYDLIIACYSLYFFPHLIKDIARILKPDGLFIAVTHSEHTLREAIEFVPRCMKKLGMAFPENLHLNRLFMEFSLENGMDRLMPHFSRVDKIDFQNALEFNRDQVEDCIYYIEKKKHLIYKEVMTAYPDQVIDLSSCLSQSLYGHVKKAGKIVLNKNDAIFRCYKNSKEMFPI